MNDFNKHVKSDTIKWIVVFTLLIVLMAGMVASILLALPEGEPVEEEQQEAAPDLAMEFNNSEHVKLALAQSDNPSGTATSTSASGIVQKTLTATVTPSTATNKLVDWEIAWGDEGKSETVTDYVTVTPASDGSTTATVACKKAFEGNIVITVTTRESGYQATCIVTFTGTPTEMVITTSVAQSGGAYKVGIGETYTFNVKLTNPFDSVNEKFNNYVCNVTGKGSIVVGNHEISSVLGTNNWYDERTVTVDSLKDSFITVSYADGVITVKTKRAIESYYKSMRRMDGGRTIYYEDDYKSSVGECYFEVFIRETNSNLNKTLKIVFDDSIVTGVSLNNSEIAF